MVEGIPGAIIDADDILIYEKTNKEPDVILSTVVDGI